MAVNTYEGDITQYVYHNENMILAEVRNMLLRMLTACGYSDWDVIRNNQPTIQKMQNNTVYFDVVSKRRYGVQGSKQLKSDGNWYEIGHWFEDWLIQVAAFKQKNPDTDDETTTTSIDIITVLQACVNGGGPKSLKDKNNYASWLGVDWLNIIRSTDLREIDYETDSGLMDKFPQFDFELVVEQSLVKENVNVSGVNLITKRV